jgi:hypothetical protein
VKLPVEPIIDPRLPPKEYKAAVHAARLDLVRGMLSEAGITRVPNPFLLWKGPLHLFAALAQQDARAVGGALIQEPRPVDYVRGMAMLGLCAGHLSEARKYARERDERAWSTLVSASECFSLNVPQWLKDMVQNG